MHSEHLQNLRPSWIAFGWFIAAAATAAVLFVLIASGVLGAESDAPAEWIAIASALGFGIGGYSAGARVGSAPILHGVAIGLFSLLAWVGVNLFFGEPTGATTWHGLSAGFTAGLLLLQIAAAVGGAWLGSRWRRVSPAA
ncbi:MAG: hypothetical protein M3409_03625 [Gemmatimonadota bacterium]|jgi:hypothetical protein|nr:hypothetical protein [Gemmatimonadota bacterium]